ncbi:MAG TPA: hypothetical protein VMA72_25385 [Streptosporangiaceae bacterium]|nr:hypothetical protein [Streptosporangiaceae bacterium]
MRPWFKGGGAGWIVVGTVVVAWDLVAPETLSAAFQRARSSPVGFAVLAVTWGALTGHLFRVLPVQADPFNAPVDFARRPLRRARTLTTQSA